MVAGNGAIDLQRERCVWEFERVSLRPLDREITRAALSTGGRAESKFLSLITQLTQTNQRWTQINTDPPPSPTVRQHPNLLALAPGHR